MLNARSIQGIAAITWDLVTRKLPELEREVLCLMP
jgi:hypothetical protein